MKKLNKFSNRYGTILEEFVGEFVFIRYPHPSIDFRDQGQIVQSVLRFSREDYSRDYAIESNNFFNSFF